MNRSFAGRARLFFLSGSRSIVIKNSNGLLGGSPLVRLSWMASLTAFLCLAVTVAFSQESATLSGMVKDSTGSSIPNAAVALTNNRTAEIKKAVTGPTGGYSLTNLAAGDYTIQISAQGFATQQKPIPLAVGQEASLDLSLSIAEEVQSVSVTGETDPYSVIPDQPTSSVFGLPEKVEEIPRSVSDADSELLENSSSFAEFSESALETERGISSTFSGSPRPTRRLVGNHPVRVRLPGYGDRLHFFSDGQRQIETRFLSNGKRNRLLLSRKALSADLDRIVSRSEVCERIATCRASYRLLDLGRPIIRQGNGRIGNAGTS